MSPLAKHNEETETAPFLRSERAGGRSDIRPEPGQTHVLQPSLAGKDTPGQQRSGKNRAGHARLKNMMLERFLQTAQRPSGHGAKGHPIFLLVDFKGEPFLKKGTTGQLGKSTKKRLYTFGPLIHGSPGIQELVVE